MACCEHQIMYCPAYDGHMQQWPRLMGLTGKWVQRKIFPGASPIIDVVHCCMFRIRVHVHQTVLVPLPPHCCLPDFLAFLHYHEWSNRSGLSWRQAVDFLNLDVFGKHWSLHMGMPCVWCAADTDNATMPCPAIPWPTGCKCNN